MDVISGRRSLPAETAQGVAVTPSVRRPLRLARRFMIPLYIACGIIAVVVVAGALAPVMAPHASTEMNLDHTYAPPVWEDGGSWDFILGTDRFGRDIFSRLMYGARYSLLLAVVSLLVGALVGTSVGLVSGYFGGSIDNICMRVVDMKLSLPTILVALVLVTLTQPSFQNLVIVIAFVLWAQYARQIRGEVLTVRQRDFVLLARITGRSSFGIIIRHIFPNVLNTLVVLVTLQLGWVILLESSLSFLGVGLPPSTPAWGLMVAEGRDVIRTAWWVSLFPGLAIAFTVLSLNLLGDWMRDALDPHLRQL